MLLTLLTLGYLHCRKSYLGKLVVERDGADKGQLSRCKVDYDGAGFIGSLFTMPDMQLVRICPLVLVTKHAVTTASNRLI